LLGLAREMVKAAYLGTTSLADAFGIGFMIPNLFRRLFAENSISVAFIPTFKAYLEDSGTEEGKKAAQEFAASVFTCVSFLTALIVLLGIVITPLLVPVFLDNTRTDVIAETVLLTRVMFPYLFVISVAAFIQGILNALKIFSPSGFTPVLFNIFVIGSAVLLTPYTKNPARAMAIGVIAGGTVQALFQLPFAVKNGWSPRIIGLKKAFANPGLRRVLALIAPTIIGMAAYQLNDVVSTALAGRTGVGIVSSLQYSLRLQELILGIFAVSIGTVLLPDLSQLAHTKRWDSFSSMLQKAIEVIALITIPVIFFSLIMGENIIILVYKSRRFTDESVRLTHEVFSFHIAGLFFIALNRIIAPAFYACGDTKSPTFAGIIGFVINIALALILAPFMQGGGIALALTLAGFANTLALLLFLSRAKTISVSPVIKTMLISTLKYTVFSLIAGAALVFAKPYLLRPFEHLNRFAAQGIPLILGTMLFGAIGVCLLIITKDTLVGDVFRRIRRRKKME
jgi:putative peptidoglycan lipid II flippase